ncbi:hypothetical protein BTN49_0251 [Candidatus Enterovibrio escicola]|uniref:Uncharacterized protein n=2 Tax=Candidatus Enterovibrio escicola TaxID=1927127 RepID=A0A2A5T7F8_9GAMM|nr:hypothetical protein BTN49_0251 [Candidatus Enterovibrio escacola]
MVTILRSNLVKRGVSAHSMSPKERILTGKTCHQNIHFKSGIEIPIAKKIIKKIKEEKIKVQAQILGDQLRVTGKSRNALQAVMQLIRESDLGQSFQFENFRD